MASQLVLDQLQKLHKELDRVQPALKQVELAQTVIEQAKKISEGYGDFTTRLEEQEAAFKEKLTTELNQRADALHKEVDAVIQSANGIVKKLNEHDRELTGIKGTIAPLADQLAAIQLKDRLTTLQETSSSTAGQLSQRTETIQGQLTQLAEGMAALDGKMETILKNQRNAQWLTYTTWMLIVAGAVITWFGR